jgi:MFS family permease
MTIDWLHFTPWLSLVGGILLGLASAAFILVNGRILGISGILGGLLSPRVGDIGWRIAFLLGMAASPWVASLVFPEGLMEAPRIEAG